MTPDQYRREGAEAMRDALVGAVQKEISDCCFGEFDDEYAKGVARGLDLALTVITKGMTA